MYFKYILSAFFFMVCNCAHAYSPYSAQLSGRIYVLMSYLIYDELSGETPPNKAHAPDARMCFPVDFDMLSNLPKELRSSVLGVDCNIQFKSEFNKYYVYTYYMSMDKCALVSKRFSDFLENGLKKENEAENGGFYVLYKKKIGIMQYYDRMFINRIRNGVSCNDKGLSFIVDKNKF